MGEKEKEYQALEERRCKEESKDNQKIENKRENDKFDLAISNVLTKELCRSSSSIREADVSD